VPRRGRTRSWPALALLAAIRGYQRWISPALGPRCRFYPSCSQYAKTAIEVHGAARGTWLAVSRLVKCQPFHPGGFDYVPPASHAGGREGSRPWEAGGAAEHAGGRRDAVHGRPAELPKGTTRKGADDTAANVQRV